MKPATRHLRSAAALLRVHTSPMQIRAMESQPPPIYIIVPGPRLPARLRRHPHAAVPPDRGAGGRRGRHPRRPQGHAADVRPGDLRRRARGPPAPALLPVHRAERRGRRLVLQLHRRGHRRRPALPAVQGHGVDRDPRRRDGRPQRVRARAPTTATTPSRSRGSPSGWGSSGSRCSSTASPTCACSTTTTSASWSSSADARPDRMAARVLRPGARRRSSWPSGWR